MLGVWLRHKLQALVYDILPSVLWRKDAVNQCLEFGSVSAARSVREDCSRVTEQSRGLSDDAITE